MRRKRAAIESCLTLWIIAAVAAGIATKANGQVRQPHNVILFIPDGLRPGSVDPKIAPTFARVRDQGVYFANSHSVFPTLTMVNSAAMSTGHFPGDTGNFANTVYTGFLVVSANESVTPMIENDAILKEVNTHFGGNYLNEESLLASARKAGFLTASIGKVGPAAVYDVTELNGTQTIIIDDATGRDGGLPVASDVSAALEKAGLPNQAPTRGDNGKTGDAKTPGTKVANVEQQAYFTDVITKVILPRFKKRASRLSWCIGRGIPMGRNTTKGTALGSLFQASMDRHPKRQSGMLTPISLR